MEQFQPSVAYWSLGWEEMTIDMILGFITFFGICGFLIVVIALTNRWAKKKYGDGK